MLTEDFIAVFWCSVVIPDSERACNVSASSKIQGKSHPCQYLTLWSSCRPHASSIHLPLFPLLCRDDIKLGRPLSFSLLTVEVCVRVCMFKKTLHGHRYECLCSCCFSVVASWCGAFTVACSFVKALNAVCY